MKIEGIFNCKATKQIGKKESDIESDDSHMVPRKRCFLFESESIRSHSNCCITPGKKSTIHSRFWNRKQHTDGSNNAETSTQPAADGTSCETSKDGRSTDRCPRHTKFTGISKHMLNLVLRKHWTVTKSTGKKGWVTRFLHFFIGLGHVISKNQKKKDLNSWKVRSILLSVWSFCVNM